MSLTIVIPAFNEENAIGQVVKQTLETMKTAGLNDCEVLVVDDGSDDKTAEVARKAGATVVTHPHNMGYGFSLKTGISSARHETIAITDADGTYPVDRLPEMLELHKSGFDMVVGQRTGKEYHESIFKSPLRAILRFIVEFTAGRTIPDINSGLRVFNRKTVMTYFSHLCNTFSFTTSMTLSYMLTDKFVKYIPIDYHKRVGASKVRLFKDSLRTLQYILQAATYFNPIKIFLLLSIVIFLLSVLGFIMTLLFGLTSTFYLGIGGFLTSALVFCLGLIADLLKQIMHENKAD